jgi:hypothetical protein
MVGFQANETKGSMGMMKLISADAFDQLSHRDLPWLGVGDFEPLPIAISQRSFFR